MRISKIVFAFSLSVAFAPLVFAGAMAEWQDVSRQVVSFDDLDDMLAVARPWLNSDELARLRSFVLERGLTEPSSVGAGMIHKTRVAGASPDEAARFLVGPATGEEGYAPAFLAETPVSEQVGPGGVLARGAHLPGIPAYFGSDARGVKLSDRIVVTWIEGRAAQGFSIHVLYPGQGGTSTEFVEIGYYVAEARVRSLFDVPGVLAVRFLEETLGKPIKALSSRAITELHMAHMNVSTAVVLRINRDRCRQVLL